MYLAHPVFRHDVIVTPKLVIVNTKLHYRSAAQRNTRLMWRAGGQETTRLAARFLMMDRVFLRTMGWSAGRSGASGVQEVGGVFV